MPARQVSDILNDIRSVHRKLAARYRELNAAASDERVKLLLEDMQHREQQFEQCVGQYVSDDGSAILDTWLQFVPEEGIRIDRIADWLAEPKDLAGLVAETLAVNAALCETYRAMAKEAPTPELHELFLSLAQLEEQIDCHYAKVLLD